MVSVPQTGSLYDPAENQDEVLYQTQRRYKGRFLFIFHHKEIHLILPDLYRVFIHGFKHMAGKKKCYSWYHYNKCNPYTADFVKWTHPSLNLDQFIVHFRDGRYKNPSLVANSTGSNQTAEKCRLTWLYTGGKSHSVIAATVVKGNYHIILDNICWHKIHIDDNTMQNCHNFKTRA